MIYLNNAGYSTGLILSSIEHFCDGDAFFFKNSQSSFVFSHYIDFPANRLITVKKNIAAQKISSQKLNVKNHTLKHFTSFISTYSCIKIR